MKAYVLPNSKVDLQKHICEYAVFGCVDFRFVEHEPRFIREMLGIKEFDYFKFPGGGKSFLAPSALREAFVKAIRTVCIEFHHIRHVLVLNHWDCGGYGFSRSFASSEDEERAYVADLKQAHAFLRAEFPQLDIQVGYSKVTPEGLTFHLLEKEDLIQAG